MFSANSADGNKPASGALPFCKRLTALYSEYGILFSVVYKRQCQGILYGNANGNKT